jgi:hypothetical protein
MSNLLREEKKTPAGMLGLLLGDENYRDASYDAAL